MRPDYACKIFIDRRDCYILLLLSLAVIVKNDPIPLFSNRNPIFFHEVSLNLLFTALTFHRP